MVRTVRELAGYAQHRHTSLELPREDVNLSCMHNGIVIAGWVALKLARGCAASTVNAQLTHLKLMMAYFAQEEFPEIAVELDALGQQLANVGKQLLSVQPARVHHGPARLRADGLWCEWMELVQAVWLHARRVLVEVAALAESRRTAREAATSLRTGRAVVMPMLDEAMATRVSNAFLAGLCVSLPPHRSRLFRTLLLVGARGFPHVSVRCPGCPDGRESSCGGNVLVRKGVKLYYLLIRCACVFAVRVRVGVRVGVGVWTLG